MGTLSYQWYLDGIAVPDATSAIYLYSAAGTSHSVTCKVTDSASTPVTSPTSNAVSVAVNPAPTPTPSPTPTPTSTSTPIATATPTLTQTTTASPSSAVPEFPIQLLLITLVVSIFAVLSATVVAKKKT
jgi:hypothetical protein